MSGMSHVATYLTLLTGAFDRAAQSRIALSFCAAPVIRVNPFTQSPVWSSSLSLHRRREHFYRQRERPRLRRKQRAHTNYLSIDLFAVFVTNGHDH